MAAQSRAVKTAQRTVYAPLVLCRRFLREIFVTVAIVTGWALVTYGVATWLNLWVLYPISAGVLLLGAAGFRFIAQVLMDGLYTLTEESDKDG